MSTRRLKRNVRTHIFVSHVQHHSGGGYETTKWVLLGNEAHSISIERPTPPILQGIFGQTV